MLDFFKKYLWLTIGLATALVLLIAVGTPLFFIVKGHQKEQRDLDAARNTLDGLNQAPLFPSKANVLREKAKKADLIDQFNELRGAMAADQVSTQAMESAAFITFNENTLNAIREQLQIGRVSFPEKYAFSFDKYAEGNPPVSKNVPRLVQQLKMMEKICGLLPPAAITNLLSFTRDEFETAAEKPAAGPPGPAEPSGPLCSTEHFKMEFHAQEGSVFDFLNRLARLPMFTAVTRLEATNPRAETSLGLAGQSQAAVTNITAEVSRDKRIMLGREELDVKLEMDVYSFGPPLDFKKEKLNK